MTETDYINELKKHIRYVKYYRDYYSINKCEYSFGYTHGWLEGARLALRLWEFSNDKKEKNQSTEKGNQTQP